MRIGANPSSIDYWHHLDDRESDWDEVLWKDYHNPENRMHYKATDKGPAYESADVSDSTYIDGLLTEKLIRDLKKLKKNQKPFFLTAGFINTHLPFNAPKKYWDLYDRKNIKQPENYNYIPKDAPKISISNWGEMRSYSNIPKQGQVSDSLAIDLIHGYYATVSYTDALIGKILKELEDQQLSESTIVVLVSDHGFNLQEHTMWAKFTNYNTATQVPLIIYNPLSKNNGTTNALTSLIDVYPTLVELCELKAPKEQLDGTSLVPILKNPELEGRKHVLIKKKNGYTLKTNTFSYTEFIKAADNSVLDKMLYDHRESKAENINVVNKKEFLSIAAEMSQTLHSAYQKNIEGE